MRLKFVIIIGIAAGIVWYGSGYSSNHNTQSRHKPKSNNNIKKMQNFRLSEHLVAKESNVAINHNKQIIEQLQLANSKYGLADLLNGSSGGLALIQNSTLANNARFANYIIPVVATNQNNAGNSSGGSFDGSGLSGGGGGSSTTPIVDSTNTDGNGDTTIIYISIYASNNVMSCNIVKTAYNINATNGMSNSSGKTPTGITNCSTVISSTNNLSGPDNILIINNDIYIVNSGNNSVTSCNLSTNGGVSSCNNYTVQVKYPMYIMQASQQQLYIYGVPNGQGIASAASCTADNNGNVINCGNPTTINVTSLPYPKIGSYTYTTNYYSNGINKCMGLSCQVLSNILMSGQNNGPTTVTATSNDVYITNYNDLVGCGIDQNSGNFFNCKILTSSLNNAEGVAIYNISSN